MGRGRGRSEEHLYPGCCLDHLFLGRTWIWGVPVSPVCMGNMSYGVALCPMRICSLDNEEWIE